MSLFELASTHNILFLICSASSTFLFIFFKCSFHALWCQKHEQRATLHGSFVSSHLAGLKLLAINTLVGLQDKAHASEVNLLPNTSLKLTEPPTHANKLEALQLLGTSHL